MMGPTVVNEIVTDTLPGDHDGTKKQPTWSVAEHAG
ncbi:hypothetical protein Pla52n_64030 [Stieleria varia]|uniref:Uncharacterized protein n=1 Tax=Stieleria varia TaxID=2528005 RepID=A0A5C5ZY66_9BACT|nr:hypothetical protein Pla52n_64030 [Stieleria varia]